MSLNTRRTITRQLPAPALATAEDTVAFLTAFNRLNRERYPFLLCSSASRDDNTQFDILPACPQYTFSLSADKTLNFCEVDDIGRQAPPAGFFELLERRFQQEKIPATDSELPFTGGWFVYLAYEMAEEIEPRLQLPALNPSQPLAWAARCPAAIIYDKQNRRLLAVAESEHAALLDVLAQDFSQLLQQPGLYTKESATISLASLQESDTGPYRQQVQRIKQYIIDGDIFQANLSRLWTAELQQDYDDASLFRALARNNPSSFAAMACLPGMSIISSSPERLVSLRNNTVETRPIAGTRPRNSRQADDQALADELLAHPKEQAEHIMLIDLERNDLGRVCQPGSIEVNELMVLETWEHVHHIVSNVRGRLQADRSPVDVLRAVFPGGTITGCPKIRCMEILAEMEQQPRGAYTGSLGYINRDGSMDFNILIRSLVRQGRDLSFRAGGGIVSDSIADNELAETRAKARGLLKMFSLEGA